jgi:DNA-directed RNA polymerase subunit RPC12/RpoP
MEPCGYCGKKRSVAARLPDDEPLCEECWAKLRRETAAMPDCPTCYHRIYVERAGTWGYRCFGCGLKFTQWMADSTAEALRNALLDTSSRPLFQPANVRILKMEVKRELEVGEKQQPRSGRL